MSEAKNSQTDGNKIIFPDFVELWKELYFKNEAAWADAFKEFVSTDTFVKMLDQSLNQHLSVEKINRQNMDKLLEHSALPSRKDLARIAELVISVEEKVDNLDYQLLDNIKLMADSLLTAIVLLEKNQQQFAVISMQNSEMKTELLDIKKQNTQLKKQITDMKKQMAAFDQKLTHINDQKDTSVKKTRSKTKVEQAE